MEGLHWVLSPMKTLTFLGRIRVGTGHRRVMENNADVRFVVSPWQALERRR
jgi:hypothetical protein